MYEEHTFAISATNIRETKTIFLEHGITPETSTAVLIVVVHEQFTNYTFYITYHNFKTSKQTKYILHVFRIYLFLLFLLFLFHKNTSYNQIYSQMEINNNSGVSKKLKSNDIIQLHNIQPVHKQHYYNGVRKRRTDSIRLSSKGLLQV